MRKSTVYLSIKFVKIAAIFFALTQLLIFAGSGRCADLSFSKDFNDSSFSPLAVGGFWTIHPSGGPDGSAAARLEYSKAGTLGKNLGLDVSAAESNEFTIEFDVRIEGNPSGGSKFVKLFGDQEATKNNMTFLMDYNLNSLFSIMYYGDSNRAVRYQGVDNETQLKYVTKTSTIDIKGSGGWNHWKAWVRRADPGQLNGAIKVWWNGELRLHATDMDSNPAEFLDPTPGFETIEFGGYNHSTFDGNTWYLWIDNLSIHSGIPPRRLSLAGRLIKLAEPEP